jgi:fructokinase
MTSVERPKVFGAGLIALDLVISSDPQSPVRSWAGGTCGNVLSILAYLGWKAYPIARLNGDPASIRVRTDMQNWGVYLDYVSCTPTAHTPIIIQEIRRDRHGQPKHRFSWSCPRCGHWLPGFKAVTIEAVEKLAPAMTGVSVFFLDRPSRAALTLAQRASEQGALVVLEPSAKGVKELFREAIQLAHIVKYADDRLAELSDAMRHAPCALLEVQTLGDQGLQYRHRFGRRWSDWLHLNAVTAPRMKDSCGSGDWCTAGLIAKIAVRGQSEFRKAGTTGLREALRYGQTLAAWNCGFEGARGGMYTVTREVFEEQIAGLLSGQLERFLEPVDVRESENMIDCPACPPKPRNRQMNQSRRVRTRTAAK